VSNTRFGTQNILIVENRFENTFGRGILLAGNSATIQSNTFCKVFGNPIQVQADIVDNYWGEGQGASNVVIRGNRFEDVNWAGRWEGAVVYTGGRLPWGPTEYPLFRRFLVEGNRFVNPPGPAVTFTSSGDCLVRNNMIELRKPCATSTVYAGTFFSVLSSNLSFEGNRWEGPSMPTNFAGVVCDPQSKNIRFSSSAIGAER
jgi:hypothetical protein